MDQWLITKIQKRVYWLMNEVVPTLKLMHNCNINSIVIQVPYMYEHEMYCENVTRYIFYE